MQFVQKVQKIKKTALSTGKVRKKYVYFFTKNFFKKEAAHIVCRFLL